MSTPYDFHITTNFLSETVFLQAHSTQVTSAKRLTYIWPQDTYGVEGILVHYLGERMSTKVNVHKLT